MELDINEMSDWTDAERNTRTKFSISDNYDGIDDIF